jgi:hypothetical protein
VAPFLIWGFRKYSLYLPSKCFVVRYRCVYSLIYSAVWCGGPRLERSGEARRGEERRRRQERREGGDRRGGKRKEEEERWCVDRGVDTARMLKHMQCWSLAALET